MLMDQGLIKNKARFVKNFEEKVREPNCENCAIGSRSEQNDVLIQFSVMIMFIYGFLMMLLITIKQMQVN